MVLIALVSIIGLIVITLQLVTLKKISTLSQRNPDSLDVSEIIPNSLQEDLHDEIHQAITLECFMMYHAVTKQVDSLHVNEIMYVMKQPSWINSPLMEHVSSDKKEQYLNFKAMFDAYMETYWLNARGSVRTVFTQEDTPTSYSEKTVRQASNMLQSKMRQWFDTW